MINSEVFSIEILLFKQDSSRVFQSFARNKSFLDHANSSPDCEVVAGGTYDDSEGYFIQPTIILCKDPNDKLLTEVSERCSMYIYQA